MRFVLASGSPARLETLRRAGVEPEVIVSGVDESQVTAPSVRDLVRVLARRKLEAVRPLVAMPALVLACDSMLELDGAALGKPSSAQVAAQRWRAMRGRTGYLHTGYSLGGPERITDLTDTTVVHFAHATDAEIELYCGTDEPTRVAGGFTLDGLGGWFVDGVEGDPHNVIGLSLRVLRELVREHGYGLADLGYPAPG